MVHKTGISRPEERGNFFHRKLAKSGGSRYLAVGKILPGDWQFVRVSVEKIEDEVCILKIEKLA